MPNRILKESICTSENIDALNAFQEVCFYRLLVNCDDFGLMDGRLKLLSAKLFPLRSVSEKQIGDAIDALRDAGLVGSYIRDGHPYLKVLGWDRHQTIRAKKSKYPLPNESECLQMQSSASRYKQMIANVPVIQSNPIQSESNPNFSTEQSVIDMPLNDGTEFAVTQSMIDEWASLYPLVDIMQSLRNMRGWCEANPAKRKTRLGVKRFIVGWLSREQDKGSTATIQRRKGSYAGQRTDDLDRDVLKKTLKMIKGENDDERDVSN